MDIKVQDIAAPRAPDSVQPKDDKADADFSFTLNKLSEDGLNDRLNNLIAEITVQGKKLADHMDIKDLKHYRGLIKDFIEEVVSNSHKFSRENFLDRRGRHRVYGIVKLINKELDSLAQDLIKKEKDHLAILGRVDEIRGMLLDIIT